MNCDFIFKKINNLSKKEINIMEVCGTHTNVISDLGLRTKINSKINLLSGPGCPVCVSDETYIDNSIKLLRNDKVVIVSFGDLLMVRGTNYSILDKKIGQNVIVIYSPLDAILIAKENPNKDIVLLAVGFETMAPIIAAVVGKSIEEKINNIFFYNALKLMEPVLRYILDQEDCNIDGIICPGNVAAITGYDYFDFISSEYNIPSAVCGFSDLEITSGIYHITKQVEYKEKGILVNCYSNVVKKEGNKIAKELINKYFIRCDESWRGIGPVELSGLRLKDKYSDYDAQIKFKIDNKVNDKTNYCNCGNVLLGKIKSNECELFGKICTPTSPKGPCMVSREGSCNALYRYMKVIKSEK